MNNHTRSAGLSETLNIAYIKTDIYPARQNNRTVGNIYLRCEVDQNNRTNLRPVYKRVNYRVF